MNPWTMVRWGEARQVAEAMGLAERERPADGIAPHAWFNDLIAAGELERAAEFLGHALPRYEAVTWAGRLIERESHRRKPARCEQQALDRALRWIDEPSEEFRRAAFAAAEEADDASAERMLGMAVFLSGGSIAPEDLAPVPAPPELSGRFAAASVVIAAHRSDDPERFLRDALALGDAIAARGLEAAAAIA